MDVIRRVNQPMLIAIIAIFTWMPISFAFRIRSCLLCDKTKAGKKSFPSYQHAIKEVVSHSKKFMMLRSNGFNAVQN